MEALRSTSHVSFFTLDYANLNNFCINCYENAKTKEKRVGGWGRSGSRVACQLHIIIMENNSLFSVAIEIKFWLSFPNGLLPSICLEFGLRYDMMIASQSSRLSYVLNWFLFDGFDCRYQEDGIQNPSVARELLLLLRLQDGHWHQVVHTAGAGDLLRRLLRGEVRHALHQVQQGECSRSLPSGGTN